MTDIEKRLVSPWNKSCSCVCQSKKSYDLRCKEADDTEHSAEKTTGRNAEKVMTGDEGDEGEGDDTRESVSIRRFMWNYNVLRALYVAITSCNVCLTDSPQSKAIQTGSQ